MIDVPIAIKYDVLDSQLLSRLSDTSAYLFGSGEIAAIRKLRTIQLDRGNASQDSSLIIIDELGVCVF
jgi:hypothetical protein